ncbi:hypothetical protein [Bacillus smithii]|uniref:hypothetical protein n=1 Tax=Bacillus smithii TaxID=1479 RepID=UPI002E2210CA|nr:hypothetical protein [Bacillus smithii]MED4929170.1 hypothetical protein [Bacillus smithii]
MQLEIHKLINSEYKPLQEFGWLLYEKENLNDGLDLDDIHKLLRIFNEETLCDLEKEFLKRIWEDD